MVIVNIWLIWLLSVVTFPHPGRMTWVKSTGFWPEPPQTEQLQNNRYEDHQLPVVIRRCDLGQTEEEGPSVAPVVSWGERSCPQLLANAGSGGGPWEITWKWAMGVCLRWVVNSHRFVNTQEQHLQTCTWCLLGPPFSRDAVFPGCLYPPETLPHHQECPGAVQRAGERTEILYYLRNSTWYIFSRLGISPTFQRVQHFF